MTVPRSKQAHPMSLRWLQSTDETDAVEFSGGVPLRHEEALTVTEEQFLSCFNCLSVKDVDAKYWRKPSLV